MTFMRIWAALLAGSCAAFIATLVGATALGLLSTASIGREPLYDVFLLAWLALGVFCAIPRNPLGQWLVAVRISTIMLVALFLLASLTTRDSETLIITAGLAGLLIWLGYALGKPGIKRETDR
tara:strand:+ start:6395 stop:6763 length:369 start_codon:yes stop_codon:yes gene_type:complete